MPLVDIDGETYVAQEPAALPKPSTPAHQMPVSRTRRFN